MLQLAIVLFIEGVTEVVDDAALEALTDEPRGADEFPLFFTTLTLVGGRGIVDGGVTMLVPLGWCTCQYR